MQLLLLCLSFTFTVWLVFSFLLFEVGSQSTDIVTFTMSIHFFSFERFKVILIVKLNNTRHFCVFRGCAVVPYRFSATNFWNYVKKYNVTWYSAVPTIHQILLMRGFDLFSSSLFVCYFFFWWWNRMLYFMVIAQNTNDVLASSEYKDVHLRFIRSCSSALSPFILQRLEEM